MTMINGKVLYYENRFYIDEDIKEIYKKVQELTKELLVVKKKVE